MRLMLSLRLLCKTAFRLFSGLVIIGFMAACASSGGVSKVKSGADSERASKAMVHTNVARGYLQQKQYSTAKASLERALQIYPQHSDSNYVMALLMNRLEQYPEAEKYYAKAVKYDRENSSAAHDYGVFLCQIGKEAKAIEYFEIAVSNPLFTRAELSYMRAGECLSKINDSRAEQFLMKALSLNPTLRPALYRLASLKYDEASYLSARAYIERFFAITNPQPAALLLAYKIESNLNAEDVANRYKRELLSDFPGSKEAATLRSSRN